MNIKPIKTDENHRAALAEIERLMDAQPETPDGDRLDVLATLVETWEEKYVPIGEPKAWLSALQQALKEGEDSGRAYYSLKELLDELDGDNP